MERTPSHTVGPPGSYPRTAVVWDALAAERERQGGRALAVVDVGGGTGGFAVPLAREGHDVTVVDPSPDALAALTRRAADAGVADRVVAVQGDGDRLAELIPAGTADLVLCHSLLEVVDDPGAVLRAVAAVLRPGAGAGLGGTAGAGARLEGTAGLGGAASVLVANQAHAVLARAMSGHLADAEALLADPGARLGPAGARRFDAATVAGLLTGAGLPLEEIHGVRVLADLVPAAVADADPGTLLALEARLSGQPPYRDIAAQLHLFARRAPR